VLLAENDVMCIGTWETAFCFVCGGEVFLV